MKKWPFLLSALLSTLLLFSCEKQDVSLLQPCETAFPLAMVTDTCFSAPTMFGFSNYPGSPTDIDAFAINPSEGSQLALISHFKQTSPDPNATFRIADICTESLRSVWDNHRSSPRRIDWSPNGWILTYRRDMDSWVRYHPGSGEIFVFGMDNFFSSPTWLSDSTFLVNEKRIAGQRSIIKTQIRGWNGNLVDSLPITFRTFAIRNESVFGYSGTFDTLFLYNTQDETLKAVDVIPLEEGFHYFSWISDTELWLVRRVGIYRFNILTLELTLLKDTSCDNYYYLSAVPHPDNPNLLYVNRKDHRYGPEGYIRFRETINLLDINTLEEKEIQFFE